MKPLLLSKDSPKILVTRTDRIGDLVLSTPVFESLKKKYPQAHVSALTFPENHEILKGNPFIDELILYDKSGSEKGWWGNLLFACALKKKKFDLVIHLHGTNRMHWVTWLAGIPVRVGWDRRLKWALTHAFPYLKKEGKKHEAEYNYDLLESLGIQFSQEIKTYFPVTERAEKSLDFFLNKKEICKETPWIVISPSASDPAKMWPLQDYARVIESLNQDRNAIFFAIGTKKDRQYIDHLRKECKVPIVDLSGQLSLSMLGAFLKRSRLLISNDSGPVHIAQAIETPVISIFVRENPGLSATRWGALEGKQVINLKELPIQVKDVLEAAEKLLNIGADLSVGPNVK